MEERDAKSDSRCLKGKKGRRGWPAGMEHAFSLSTSLPLTHRVRAREGVCQQEGREGVTLLLPSHSVSASLTGKQARVHRYTLRHRCMGAQKELVTPVLALSHKQQVPRHKGSAGERRSA